MKIITKKSFNIAVEKYAKTLPKEDRQKYFDEHLLKPHKSWKTTCKEAARKLTKEKQQEFLDLIFLSGMTLGEAGDKCGLNFDEWSGIIMLQSKNYKYIDSLVK